MAPAVAFFFQYNLDALLENAAAIENGTKSVKMNAKFFFFFKKATQDILNNSRSKNALQRKMPLKITFPLIDNRMVLLPTSLCTTVEFTETANMSNLAVKYAKGIQKFAELFRNNYQDTGLVFYDFSLWFN